LVLTYNADQQVSFRMWTMREIGAAILWTRGKLDIALGNCLS